MASAKGICNRSFSMSLTKYFIDELSSNVSLRNITISFEMSNQIGNNNVHINVSNIKESSNVDLNYQMRKLKRNKKNKGKTLPIH